MSWVTDIVTIAGPAGLVSAVLTHGLSGWRERRKSVRQGQYLALRLAVILERYASECNDLVARIDAAADANVNPDNYPTDLPPAPSYPEDDEGWRVLYSALAHRALALVVERNAAQAAVAEDWFHHGSTSAPFECSRLAAILGWEAWETAVDLRLRYSLPPYLARFPFNKSLFMRVRKNERDREAAVERMRQLAAEQASSRKDRTGTAA
jgi:hypothetical protein